MSIYREDIDPPEIDRRKRQKHVRAKMLFMDKPAWFFKRMVSDTGITESELTAIEVTTSDSPVLDEHTLSSVELFIRKFEAGGLDAWELPADAPEPVPAPEPLQPAESPPEAVPEAVEAIPTPEQQSPVKRMDQLQEFARRQTDDWATVEKDLGNEHYPAWMTLWLWFYSQDPDEICFAIRSVGGNRFLPKNYFLIRKIKAIISRGMSQGIFLIGGQVCFDWFEAKEEHATITVLLDLMTLDGELDRIESPEGSEDKFMYNLPNARATDQASDA